MYRLHFARRGRRTGISRRSGKPHVGWRCWGWVIATASRGIRRTSPPPNAVVVGSVRYICTVQGRRAGCHTVHVCIARLLVTIIMNTFPCPTRRRAKQKNCDADQTCSAKNSGFTGVHIVLSVQCCLRPHIFQLFSVHRCTVRNWARGYAEKLEFSKPRIPQMTRMRTRIATTNPPSRTTARQVDANEHQFIRISVDSC